MNNLSDTEIIKALECCYPDTPCTGCPLLGKGCMDKLYKYALDLINRLKAENVRVKQERDKEHNHCNHYARMCAKVKSEARKEFAERLKRKAKKPYGNFYEPTVFVEDIDNLLKEMG